MDIRIATAEDIDDLIKVRLAFVEAFRPLSEADKDNITTQLRSYFPEQIANEKLFCFLGYVDGDIASVAFMLLTLYPANWVLRTGRMGLVLNVYTFDAHRRQGYGKQIIDAVLEKARELGLDGIDLEATTMGRVLYEQAGFEVRPYTPMRLAL